MFGSLVCVFLDFEMKMHGVVSFLQVLNKIQCYSDVIMQTD